MHDQTKNEWLDQQTHSKLGTGIFLFEEPENKESGLKMEYREKIPYEVCKEISHSSIAFQWVPLSVASCDELRNQSCGSTCEDTCVRRGCLCNMGRCIGGADV